MTLSFKRARYARWQRVALRYGCWLVPAAFSLALAAQAHDWASPGASPSDGQARPLRQSGWSGMLWDGPRSGVPAAPSAGDCARPAQPVDMAGPAQPRTGRRHGHGSAAADAHVASPSSDRLRAYSPAVTVEPAAAPGSDRRRAEIKAEAAAANKMAGTRAAEPGSPPPPAAAPRDVPPREPAQRAYEPVTAGVVDDNADFGGYLAYRRRHQGSVNVRDRDISERYRLSVHDSQGRPVPDAQVSAFANGRPLPLWARTDAGGQAWIHPRVAGVNADRLELRVTRASADGELQGSALLRRGQRDALQVRLDGVMPGERARLDLVFLVDATGSMGDEIDKLKRSMRAVAQQIDAMPGHPDVCWSLVAYRDRGDEFFVRAWDFSNDLGGFQQALSGLRAGGGGDYPEALNEALHTAVHRLSWRGDGATRMVVLLADAPPHLDYGAPWYDDDMQGALARGIKLFGVAASGLDASGEYIFRQMAQYTGGRFVFLTYDKAHNPASGPGRETVHDVGNYSVETLDRLIVRLVGEELARRPQ